MVQHRKILIIWVVVFVGTLVPLWYLHFHKPELQAEFIEAEFFPRRDLTPGDVFPHVKAEHLAENGYTARVRRVTPAMKRRTMEKYGLNPNESSNYEIDHLISLELGGSNDESNLWPEPYYGVWNARVKDTLENKLHRMVVDHEITLSNAQREIAENWVEAYKKYVGKEAVQVPLGQEVD